jgi:putative FmdB family regulatory protein
MRSLSARRSVRTPGAGTVCITAQTENKEKTMPTYEYECIRCGHRFEKFQSITAAPIKCCPKCGKKVKRLLGAGVGLIFKGSGFYATDYRSDSYKKAAKAEQEGQSSKTGGEGAGRRTSDGKEET